MGFYSTLSGTTLDKFSHNNMIPFFGGGVTQNMGEFANSTILEKYTGADNKFQIKKNEQACFSDLKKNNITYTTEGYDITRDRLNTPVFHNNVLPTEQIRVGVGSKNTDNTNPSGGFQQDDFRDFDIYKTTDDIRVKTNPKETFEARNVDGMKEKLSGEVGEVRKNRVDMYYEKKHEDLFKTPGAVLKAAKRPCEYLKNTNRISTTTEYTGTPYHKIGSKLASPVTNSNKPQYGSYGEGRNTKTVLKKGNIDDFGRNAISVYTNERDVTTTNTYTGNISSYVKSMVAPVMDTFRRTNKELMVKSAREFGPMQTGVKKQTLYNPNSIAKPTIKETLIHDTRNGNISGSKKTTTYDPNDIAKTTVKETLIHDTHSGQIKTTPKQIVYDPSEIAKRTVRETLDHEETVLNMRGNIKQTLYDPNDVARTTIKETHVENDEIGNVSGLEKANGYLSSSFNAPATNKQITSDNEYIGNPEQQESDGYKNISFSLGPTNKQITSDNEYIGNGIGHEEMMSYESIYNTVISNLRQDTLVEHEPTQTGVKLSQGTENITLTSTPSKPETHSVNMISRIYQDTPNPLSNKFTKEKENYKESDRFDPTLLKVFNNNPYTHSLHSAV